MFAKKPLPPEPKLPGLPPVLRISGPERLESISEEAPNTRIAHAIIVQAFREGATQITLTPDGAGTQVHYLRVGDGAGTVVHYLREGEWQHTMTLPAQVAPGVVAAFKTLAGLPLWEHRMALEGLIVVQHGEADYDVHLAITPTRHGEKVALRMVAV